MDAQYQVKGAEAELNNLKAQLQNQLMDQKAKAAVVRSAFHQAQIQRETNAELFKLGLTSDVILRTSQVAEEELGKQNEIAEKQVETFANSIDAQIAVQQAKVDQLHALAQLKQSQVEQLKIRPGIDGMLQELDVEVGQKVTAGTVLARVAQPQHLKAQLKIAETQAKDIVIGQKATIDTHNGIIHRARKPHRSRGAERDGDRGLLARRRDSFRGAAGFERRRDGGTRAADRRSFCRTAGARRSEQHDWAVQDDWPVERCGRGDARAGSGGAHVGEFGGSREGIAGGGHGDFVGHVAVGQF